MSWWEGGLGGAGGWEGIWGLLRGRIGGAGGGWIGDWGSLGDGRGDLGVLGGL